MCVIAEDHSCANLSERKLTVAFFIRISYD
jgi:hypothetical protein